MKVLVVTNLYPTAERPYAIVTDDCFSSNGIFHVTPGAKPHDIEELFRYKVFKMLKAEGKITDARKHALLASGS
jgi:hypothetical protein